MISKGQRIIITKTNEHLDHAVQGCTGFVIDATSQKNLLVKITDEDSEFLGSIVVIPSDAVYVDDTNFHM